MDHPHFITKIWTICVVQADFSKLCQLQSHVKVPLLQAFTGVTMQTAYGADSAPANVDGLLGLTVEVTLRQYTSKLHGKGNTDFQLTRGYWGFQCKGV